MSRSKVTASAAPQRGPILLADDNPDDLSFSTRLVQKTGTHHPVMTFSDGGAVVDFLLLELSSQPRATLPRLLFLDLKMTGLGGFDFLEWKVAHSEFRELMVIVLSGSSERRDVELAKRLGANGFLTKHPGVATFGQIVQQAYGEPDLTGAYAESSTDDYTAPGSGHD